MIEETYFSSELPDWAINYLSRYEDETSIHVQVKKVWIQDKQIGALQRSAWKFTFDSEQDKTYFILKYS